MATLNMKGPYPLTAAEIDKQVTGAGAGNFALVDRDSEGCIRVCYVGRADADLNEELHHWIGRTRRPFFKFSFAASPQLAFEKECEAYHNFMPNDNRAHPTAPAKTVWNCPRCSKTEAQGFGRPR